METFSAAARVQANLQDLFQANLSPGEAYIKFQLTEDLTALLSMKQVQGSMIVPADKITPLPSMPEPVIGMMSLRGRVFCVFDLAKLLTFSSSLVNLRQYQIIVLQTNDEQPIYIGLAVTQLQGIMRIATEKIQSSLENIPSNIASYLCGAFREEERMLPVLEFNRILEALISVQ